jgi:protein-tyrosine-phosphatase
MAAAILKDIIAKDRKLNTLNIFVDSAAMDNQYCGAPATISAIKEMKKRGLDITGHISKPIDNLKLSEYDLILTMERNQQDDILAQFPKLEGHVFTVANYAGDSEDIADPIDTGKYSKCADQLVIYLIKIAERLADCNINTTSTDDVVSSRSVDYPAVRSRWVEGIVSNWSEHIRISFHEQDDDIPLIPVARIAPGHGRTTIVQFILKEDLPSLKTEQILKDVKRQFDFFLSEKDEPDPWNYAMYHCTTAGMLYSTVWWGYYPGPPVNCCFQSEIIKGGSIMSIDSFNKRIEDLWRKYEKEKKLTLSPLLYSEPNKRGILFISLNPASPKAKETEFYKFNNLDNNRINEIKERHKKDLESLNFFQPFREISDYVGLKMAQIDLFYYRETKQDHVKKMMYKRDEHKLNEFAVDQLKISLDIINYINPKIIIVANAFARDILKGKKGDFSSDIAVGESDKKYGISHMKIANKSYPTVFTRMLTGRWRLDSNSYEKLKQQIKKYVVNELNLK